MYIEDLIHRLANGGHYLFHLPMQQLSPRDSQIIESFSAQLLRGLSLTEKQATMAVKFCLKYKNQLEQVLNCSLESPLNNPQFKNPFRVLSENIKTVSLVAVPRNAIKLSFMYDERIVNMIRTHKKNYTGNTAEWDSDSRAWMLGLTECNILFVKNTLLPEGFIVAPEVLGYIEEIDTILADIDQYIPIVSMNDSSVSFKNVHPNVPQPTTNNVLESLFQARKYGIVTWDDTAETYVNSKVIPLTSSFLNNPLGNQLFVDSTVVDIAQFSDIIKYSKDILVIVPGVNELLHLKKWYAFLMAEEVSVDEVAVLFRLNNASDKEFNQYVKDNGLNLPVNETTRIFFISQKLPKPLIKMRKEFDVVINLGNGPVAHYSIQNLIEEHHDVITYNLKKIKGN